MSGSPLRVLVVDDSRIFRAAIAQALAGCPDVKVVGSVYSGEQALDFCRRSPPDLITLDLHMPGLSGLETLRSLREVAPPQSSPSPPPLSGLIPQPPQAPPPGTRGSPASAPRPTGLPDILPSNLPGSTPLFLPGVLVVSTLTRAGAEITLQALQAGAFDFIHKPEGPDPGANSRALRRQLLEKLAVFRASRRTPTVAPRPPASRPAVPRPDTPRPTTTPPHGPTTPPVTFPRSGGFPPSGTSAAGTSAAGFSPPGIPPAETSSRSGHPPTTPPPTTPAAIPPARSSPSPAGRPVAGQSAGSPPRVPARPASGTEPRLGVTGDPLSRFRAVVIGASTGGPAALAHLLPQLAPHSPVPVFVVTHLLTGFSEFLAESLARRCPDAQIVEAREGVAAGPRQVFLAPGGRHLRIRTAGDRLFTALDDSPPELGFRPAVDVLFRSAAVALRDRVLAVVLTGMDRDGTQGAIAIRDAGGHVLVQDELSSVVWGMPGNVVAAGAAHEIVPLTQLGRTLRWHLGIPTPASPPPGSR